MEKFILNFHFDYWNTSPFSTFIKLETESYQDTDLQNTGRKSKKSGAWGVPLTTQI